MVRFALMILTACQITVLIMYANDLKKEIHVILTLTAMQANFATPMQPQLKIFVLLSINQEKLDAQTITNVYQHADAGLW
eukprot:CAMPEP_0202947118 /NCGR_PEP_ID=MMETSP1395-20130829/10767_1 /ASSEMBLY_ACC=CAM_ASM_000871 /TAXON_ID=5961 /ORGANISM="Blepharisma japonicum, Strain Stock R1072" /LENGTH=79 /DNA_ID=CAMNT_0049648153 /DNA_START=256 /DNA_END=492 /DNA_ORIENTATION=+